MIPIRNLEVFPELEESLLCNRIRDITIGIGFVKILYVLQEIVVEVTGRGVMVEI